MSRTTDRVISLMNEETITVRDNALYLSNWEKLHLVNSLKSELRNLEEWLHKSQEDKEYWKGQIRLTRNLLEVVEKQLY